MKKITSILLALVMVLTLLPAAWAEGVNGSAVQTEDSVARVTVGDESIYYTDLDDAFAYAVSEGVNGATVTLLEDGFMRECSVTIPAEKAVTINLNGHILWTDTAGLAALDTGKVEFSGTGSVDATDWDNDGDIVRSECREYKDSFLIGTTTETNTYYADETLRIKNHKHNPIPCLICNGKIEGYICGICGVGSMNYDGSEDIPESAQAITGTYYFPNNTVESGKEKATTETVVKDGNGNITYKEITTSINQYCNFSHSLSSERSRYENGQLIELSSSSITTAETSFTETYCTKDANGNYLRGSKTVATLTGSTLTIVHTGLDENGAATDVTTETYTVSGQKATLTKVTDTTYLAKANAGEAATNETEQVYDNNGNLTTEIYVEKDGSGNVLRTTKSVYIYNGNTTTCTQERTFAGSKVTHTTEIVTVKDGSNITETITDSDSTGRYVSVQTLKGTLDQQGELAYPGLQPVKQVDTEKNAKGEVVCVTTSLITYEGDKVIYDITETDGSGNVIEIRHSEAVHNKIESGEDTEIITFKDPSGNKKYVEKWTWKWEECSDQKDNRIVKQTVTVYNENDVKTETRETTYTYSGNTTTEVTRVKNGADVLVETWEYVTVANPDNNTETSTETIKDATGGVKSIETWTWSGDELVDHEYTENNTVDGKKVETKTDFNTTEATTAEVTVKKIDGAAATKAEVVVKVNENAEISADKTVEVKGTVSDYGDKLTEVTVSIPKTDVKKLESAKAVEVKTDVGTLSIDKKAMEKLASKVESEKPLELSVANTSAESKEVQNTASDVKAEYKLTATVGSENVFDKSTADTNGEITVSVPYEKSTNGTVAVYYVDEATNAKTKMPSSYADGVLSWTTNHFSTFQVVETVQSSSSGNRHYSAVLASKTANTTTAVKVNSASTFDAGVGIYAASAILSVTGMAWVGKKKF